MGVMSYWVAILYVKSHWHRAPPIVDEFVVEVVGLGWMRGGEE
jgi:hypothetical protein